MRIHTLILPFLVMTACGPDEADPPPRNPQVPAQEIEDFAFTETRLGIPRWTLNAQRLSDFRVRERVIVGGVAIDFFQPAADSLITTSTLVADSGEFHRSSRDMRVWGNVVVTNREGTVLRTGWLLWKEQSECISTEDTVLVSRGADTLQGRGLESDPELRHVRILSDVTGAVGTRD